MSSSDKDFTVLNERLLIRPAFLLKRGNLFPNFCSKIKKKRFFFQLDLFANKPEAVDCQHLHDNSSYQNHTGVLDQVLCRATKGYKWDVKLTFAHS